MTRLACIVANAAGAVRCISSMLAEKVVSRRPPAASAGIKLPGAAKLAVVVVAGNCESAVAAGASFACCSSRTTNFSEACPWVAGECSVLPPPNAGVPVPGSFEKARMPMSDSFVKAGMPVLIASPETGGSVNSSPVKAGVFVIFTSANCVGGDAMLMKAWKNVVSTGRLACAGSSPAFWAVSVVLAGIFPLCSPWGSGACCSSWANTAWNCSSLADTLASRVAPSRRNELVVDRVPVALMGGVARIGRSAKMVPLAMASNCENMAHFKMKGHSLHASLHQEPLRSFLNGPLYSSARISMQTTCL